MEIYTDLASAMTVISFIVFIGIVAWAYSSRRKEGFDKAARAPFALPDEADGPSPAGAPGARR